jgi:thiamine transport system substrate-binding protein
MTVMVRRRVRRVGVLLATGLLALPACSSTPRAGDDSTPTVTLVTHDSFSISKDSLAQFTKATGYQVKILRGGDAGVTVNRAILTAKNPQGDVLFGLDNTLLSRALDAGIFTAYEPDDLDEVPEALRLDRQNRVTPIDYADVCVNYDKRYFSTRHLSPPQSLADLGKPEYRGLLVVENPAASSPGLAFLLGTVAEFGPAGYLAYWQQLRRNGVLVTDGWEEAYNGRFSGSSATRSSGQGGRPLVVSYGTSPAAEVVFGGKAGDQPPTGVVTGTCSRQVEFAGLLKGARHPDAGRKLLDFLLSERFQKEVPLGMFVFPARSEVELPPVFAKNAVTVTSPKGLSPRTIAEHRDSWVKAWTATVLR